MNKLGIYFAFWEREWKADYIKYIRKVKGLGFDVLEIEAGALLDMTKEERAGIAQAAKENQIDLTYCIGLSGQYDLASEDSRIRKEGIAHTGKILEAIHSMGGNMLGGIIYSCWPGKTVSYDYKMRARERSLTSVKELGNTAQAYGIDYCLEVVNRFEQHLLNTAKEGTEFVKETENPRIKLLLDTFHMNIEEDSLYDGIMEAKDVLGHFHIGECNRKVPGRGHMDWNEIIRGLRDSGYQGKIVMEPFVKPGGQVSRDIKIYRDLSQGASEEEMDAMAKEAFVFMKKKLAEGVQ